MAEQGPESNGGVAAAGKRAGTPQSELARLRASQAKQSEAVREQIVEAMLVVCGREGYRQASVREVLEAYGGNRIQFYHHFAGKAECYATAYDEVAGRLCADLLETACRQPTWRAGLGAALARLARFATSSPLLAKGLLAEVHVAGGPALAKREELLARLASAVDSARRASGARYSPPPVTASFMVSAIEASLISALARGNPEQFAAAVPELAHMVVSAYFGEAAAEEDFSSLRAAAPRAA